MATTKLGALFLALPLELREEILLYAMLPLPELSTANIPNTPDNLTIPPIAQVSRSLRAEALGVFFRNRPLEIALYSTANENLTSMWLARWTQGGRVWRDITFTGNVVQGEWMHGRERMFGSFKLTIVPTRVAGKYAVSVTPCAMPVVQQASDAMKRGVEEWLAKRKVVGEEYGFAGAELRELVRIVLKATRLESPL